MSEQDLDRTYTLFWLGGKRQVLKGANPGDALGRAGYGYGALMALDFYAEGENNEYVWSAGSWVKTQNAPERDAETQQ